MVSSALEDYDARVFKISLDDFGGIVRATTSDGLTIKEISRMASEFGDDEPSIYNDGIEPQQLIVSIANKSFREELRTESINAIFLELPEPQYEYPNK